MGLRGLTLGLVDIMWSLLYVIALIASSVAAFGVSGLFPATIVIACWSFVYLRTFGSGRLRRLGRALVVLLILMVTLALLLPSVQNARKSSRRASCANNLLQIWYGLDHYRKQHGDFPAGSTSDVDGKPLLSWRTALLPYLERNDVYRRIDQTRPWNDAANEISTATRISFYVCPSDPSELPATNYFAVVDPRTIWRRDPSEPPKATTDAPSQTIMLIEAYGRGIPWASPEDLTFDEATKLLTEAPSIAQGHWSCGHVLFANGTVGFVGTPLTRATAEALLTCNGGEAVDAGAIEIVAPIQPHRINQWALILFLLLSLLPVVRLGVRSDAQGNE